ncbi:MAG: sodium:calcium symporter [Phycisphaeraceae bacterium]|nr:sodium:calcium symporter [Phycisphaeraceae bacterium]
MNQPNGSGESWGTRLGVILAVTGSAVGLGNFLRFPGLAAQFEGGAFMIPYAVAFLILGLPIAWVEWSMGRYGGKYGFNSTPGCYFAICNRSRPAAYMGVLGLLVPVMIYMFYVFIEAWCLGFAWKYLIGDPALLGTATDTDVTTGTYVLDFVGIKENGSLFHNFFGSSLVHLLICFVLNFVLIYRGLNKGIEWFCKWAMPALVLCAVIVLIRVLTLAPNPVNENQNVINGLGYMWNPGGIVMPETLPAEATEAASEVAAATTDAVSDATPEKKSLLTTLSDPEIWLAAAGQIFFSLSVGFGVIITYSSYLKKDDDVALSSLTAAAGNGFCEVALGGMILIPAAFVFLGVLDEKTLDSAFQLGFMVLPQVFAQMPGGQFFGFLFFFLLFLAAVTSSLSMLQPAIAFLEEGLDINRKMSVTILGFVTFVGTMFVVYFSENLAALDAIDFWVATFCIYVLATVQVIIFGWVLGVDEGYEELMTGAEIKVHKSFKFIVKYVSPLFLLIIFAVWIFKALPKRIENIGHVEGLALGFIAIMLTFFLLLIASATKRWNKTGKGKVAQ